MGGVSDADFAYHHNLKRQPGAISGSETPPTNPLLSGGGNLLLIGLARFDRFVDRQDVRRHRGEHQYDNRPSAPIFVKAAALRMLGMAVIVVPVVVAVVFFAHCVLCTSRWLERHMLVYLSKTGQDHRISRIDKI